MSNTTTFHPTPTTILRILEKSSMQRFFIIFVLPSELNHINLQSHSAYSASNNDVTKTKFGKSLYRGKMSSHAHFFMADYGIEAASRCDSLFIDGTFSTCPFPFFQTVTLLGKVGEKVFLLGWALLPNKLESTYKDVLHIFRDTCSTAGKDLDFSFIYMDDRWINGHTPYRD